MEESFAHVFPLCADLDYGIFSVAAHLFRQYKILLTKVFEVLLFIFFPREFMFENEIKVVCKNLQNHGSFDGIELFHGETFHGKIFF